MGPLVPRRYSERLGVIDSDQLQAAADVFGLGAVTDAEPATGGLFGQNIILTTKNGEYVLRGNPHGFVQLVKERRVARYITENSSLPAPWPYEVCEDVEIFGWPFAVMPLLPGTMGQTLHDEADDDDRVALADAAGEALARLHEAEREAPGPYDAQLDDFVEMDDFRDWTLHRLQHWRSACRSVNALSTEAERFIDDVIEANADALNEPFTPVLVHHDFKYGNLNFENKNGAYEPAGVFDLFEAYIGDGEEDLVRMLWVLETDHERQAFVDAYADNWPLRDGAPDRLAIYALADWLVIWEYGCRVGWFEEGAFLTRARPIVETARRIGSDA